MNNRNSSYILYMILAVIAGGVSSVYPLNLYAGAALILILLAVAAINHLHLAVILAGIALSTGKVEIYKNLNVFDISVILLFLSYLKSNSFKLTLQGWPVKSATFLIIFSTIPLLKAIDPVESLFNVLQFYFLIFSAFVFFQVFRKTELVPTFLKSWVISSIVFIAMYIIPFIMNSNYLNLYSDFLSSRASYTFLDPNYFASYLVTLLPFMFLGMFSHKFKNSSVVLLIGMGLVMVSIVLTYSRASWLTLILILFMLTIAFVKWNKKGLLPLAGLASLFIIAMYFLGIMEYSIERFSSLFDSETNDGSITERRLILFTVFNVIKDHYVFGIGLDMFQRVYAVYQPVNFRSFADTHNTFLTIWVEIGTFGFLSFISFLYLTLIKGVRDYIKFDQINLLIGISIVAFLVSSFFINNVYSRAFWCLMGLLLATKTKKELHIIQEQNVEGKIEDNATEKCLDNNRFLEP